MSRPDVLHPGPTAPARPYIRPLIHFLALPSGPFTLLAKQHAGTDYPLQTPADRAQLTDAIWGGDAEAFISHGGLIGRC